MSLSLGCGREIVRTETVKVMPPKALLAPRPCPDPPAVVDEMTVGDLVQWYEDYVASLRKACAMSEADKAAVRDWCENSGEKNEKQ